MAILIALHVLAAVIWVGGMTFAYLVLRPAAGELQAEARLPLWHRVFGRFFPLVWASIAVLLGTGYGMMALAFGGFAGAPLHVHLMQALGILMMLLFFHLYFAPWRRFSAAIAGSDFAAAGKQLDLIRMIVAINLVLGLITIVVGTGGRYW
jgi:uncharacterized membrane protein